MQTKLQSFYESLSNTAIGFGFSFVIGLLVYPLFGIVAGPLKCFGLTLVFTLFSVFRNFVVRRWFNNHNDQIVIDRKSYHMCECKKVTITKNPIPSPVDLSKHPHPSKPITLKMETPHVRNSNRSI